MSLYFAQRLPLRGLLAGLLLSGSIFPLLAIGPATSPAQSSQLPQVTKSPEGKKEEAANAAARAKAHHFDRVVIVVLENADYEVVSQNPDFQALAQRGASFSNFHAEFHPSYPNYLALVAGTDFEVHRRGRMRADGQKNFPDDADHRTIADRLIAAGLDFKQYAEELPQGTCPWTISGLRIADRRGNYVRRHVPFLSFRAVQQKWCDRVVRVDSSNSDNYFVQDVKKGLVAYSFYSPNMNHDGHDTNAKVAGAWVRQFLEKKFPEKQRKGTLVVITFDESDKNSDNRISTILLGDMVKEAGQQDGKALAKPYNHYSLLRTIEDNFGLEPLTENDRNAAPITEIWK